MPVVLPAGLIHDVVPGQVVAVIPARYGATRLPGKPLAVINGRTMVEHVYRRAAEAEHVSAVLVATDDERIADAVDAFGGLAVMTRRDHLSGTDRLAEVAEFLRCDLVVNVQGDEPLVDPASIDATVAALLRDPTIPMGTLRRRLDHVAETPEPNIVKLVIDQRGDALYFTRATVPFVRPGHPSPVIWRHLGLYVYRRDVLLRLARLAPTPLELAEGLEQLRALEHGIRIRTVETTADAVAVDTEDDLNRVRRLLETTTHA